MIAHAFDVASRYEDGGLVQHLLKDVARERATVILDRVRADLVLGIRSGLALDGLLDALAQRPCVSRLVDGLQSGTLALSRPVRVQERPRLRRVVLQDAHNGRRKIAHGLRSGDRAVADRVDVSDRHRIVSPAHDP